MSTLTPFSGEGAQRLVADLLQDPSSGGGPGTTASEVLTRALREVNESGVVENADEGWRGIAAVAILLAESVPSVLDGAPEEGKLRDYLERWDTELTPARRTLSRAVLGRLRVTEDNAWWAAVSGTAGGGPAGLALVDRLEGLLADV